MVLGYVEGVTHNYIRHGTTTLFAALDVATGEVLTQCRPRHRHQEFLGFLRQIEKSVPEDLDVHLIVDNYCTHKHAKVRAWLALRPRFHVHYTPTYASWLNQVERCYRFAGLRLRDHHPACDPTGQLLQRHGADRQDRAVRGGLQHVEGAVQMDRHGGFNPREAPETLLANLRDGTLVPCILSDWPSKDQHFVLTIEPTAWRGVQHGVDAPQQDFTCNERAG
jgi:transposase